MRLSRTFIPVGALVMAVGIGGLPAYAGQRDSQGRDRNGRESQGQRRERSGGDVQPRDNRGGRVESGQDRGGARDERGQGGASRDGGQDRGPSIAPAPRATERAERREPYRYDQGNDRRYDGSRTDRRYESGRRYESDRRYQNDRRYDTYRLDPRYDSYRRYGYVTPRIVPGRPRHYYGPGGNFSAYFGWGNGYRYGAPWTGRVYGYVPQRAYGVRIYYGDVRLQVRPRDAAVYVDGYYAGVVDDFDGVFQRLTLEVGPHQIELDAPGLEPQVFDIYVDPARTIDIRTDLFR